MSDNEFAKTTCCFDVNIHTGTQMIALISMCIEIGVACALQSLLFVPFVVIKSVVCILMFYAVLKKRLTYYLPYLIYTIIETVVFLVKAPYDFWQSSKDLEEAQADPVKYMEKFCVLIILICILITFLGIFLPYRSYELTKYELWREKLVASNRQAVYIQVGESGPRA